MTALLECKTAIQKCVEVGMLKESGRQQWTSNEAFQFAHWKGDDVLAQEMRDLVHKKFGGGSMMLGEKAKLTEQCVGTRSSILPL